MEFLNRVYVNGFAKLAVGKARYGVMLNDDGVVLDDGTTSRIGQDHYDMTTTTAQAGEVMSWLEYLLQCHWTDLRVHVASLTDEMVQHSCGWPEITRGVATCISPNSMFRTRHCLIWVSKTFSSKVALRG